MIRDVFFDLDNTLLDFNRSERRAISLTLKHIGAEASEENIALYSRINLSQWKLLEKGELTLDRLRVRRFELLFEALGIEADAHSSMLFYGDRLGEGFFLTDGAADALEALHGRYRLHVASNGIAETQHSRLKGAGLEKYFENVFISQEIGCAKPDKRFFEHCFAAIADFEKSAAVIIGDSLSSDILGGRNADIATVLVSACPPPSDAPALPDRRITSLYELPDLLEKL